MRIVHKSIEKNQAGWIKLVADDAEDIWNVYNLINANDQLETVTYRRVQTETASGKMDSERVKMVLCLTIQRVDVDLTTNIINAKGTNCTENRFVKIGAYHTSTVEIGQPFKVWKQQWDSVSLQRIHHCCNVQEKAEIAAVLVQEGLCNICLVTEYSTTVAQTVVQTIPKKRRGISTANFEKSLDKFYGACTEGVLKWINLDKIKVLVVAGPGFASEQLYRHIQVRLGTEFNKHKGKFIVTHCTSALKQSLDELLRNAEVVPRIANTRFAQNAKMMDTFMSMLSNDPCRAYFGYPHVYAAWEMGAVSDLLISDSLFRSVDLNERMRYIKLVDEVRNSGAKVHIFSSAHSTGEQLDNLCGVAAILRFSVPELEEIEFQP